MSTPRKGTAALSLSLLLALSLPPAAAAQDEVPHEESEISLSELELAQGETLTISYSTESPHSQNWIGIYPQDVNPGTNPSTLWEYAPEDSGELEFSAEDLEAGEYYAWFLAEDGYEELAEPIAFTVTGE